MQPVSQSQSVLNHFDRAASTYDDHATVQRQVADDLIAFLPPHCDPKHILEVGCGSGYLTSLLREAYPKAQLTALDLAPRMIEEAKRQLPASENINWQIGELTGTTFSDTFDMIISGSSLHWLEDLSSGLNKLASLLNPGGHLSFALMLNGTLKELHELRRRICPTNTPALRMPEPKQIETSLLSANLILDRSLIEPYFSEASSAKSLFMTLKNLGVTGGHLSQAHKPLQQAELFKILAAYNREHSTENNNVVASYQVGFFNAHRPPAS